MADEQGSPESVKLTQFSMSKIKTIMKSSPDLTNISQDSIFLVARATELFIGYLTQAALKKEENKKLLSYKALAQVVGDEDCLEFLGDIVPPKMLVKDYFASLKISSKKSDKDADPVAISSSDSD